MQCWGIWRLKSLAMMLHSAISLQMRQTKNYLTVPKNWVLGKEKNTVCLFCEHQVLAAWAAQQLQWESGLCRNDTEIWISLSGWLEWRRLFCSTELDLRAMRSQWFTLLMNVCRIGLWFCLSWMFKADDGIHHFLTVNKSHEWPKPTMNQSYKQVAPV